MWQCFTVFEKKIVFLVWLRLSDLSVSPAEREKLSPSKLPLVKPVKVQPCLTPNTSASFLETHIFAQNTVYVRPREKAKFVHIKVQPSFPFGGSWVVVQNYNTEYISYGQSPIVVHVLKRMFCMKTCKSNHQRNSWNFFARLRSRSAASPQNSWRWFRLKINNRRNEKKMLFVQTYK